MDRDTSLKNANIEELEWINCYVSDDGRVFTPKYDIENKMIKTGEEVYKDYINSMNNPIAPQPTSDEILRAKLIKDNVAMQLQLAQQQQINANLLSQTAKLGGTQ